MEPLCSGDGGGAVGEAEVVPRGPETPGQWSEIVAPAGHFNPGGKPGDAGVEP